MVTICIKCKQELPAQDFWKNQKACKTCQRAYRDNNPARQERGREAAWRYGLNKLGVTPEMYWEMFEAQGGVCAICGTAEAHRKLSVDHCHGSGKIRGLLCHKCNVGIGLFDDDPNRLTTAICYLTAQNG